MPLGLAAQAVALAVEAVKAAYARVALHLKRDPLTYVELTRELREALKRAIADGPAEQLRRSA